MKLYEFMKITMGDYDTYDTVYDACVTVCYIDEKDINDYYDRFCIEIMKKVEMEKQVKNHLIVKWTDLIQNNMEKFKQFTMENWRKDCQYEDDEDEFIYQWIREIDNYICGNVSENFYKKLYNFVKLLKA